MAIEIWIAFVVASGVLLAIPGPTVLIVVVYAMAHGKRSAWRSVPGVALGDLTAMTLSVAGAGAILASSATLYGILKFCGAAYLIWLAIGLWRAPAQIKTSVEASASAPEIFWKCYVVTALNPKSIFFFAAFVPQFIDPGAELVPQLSIMIATFVVMAVVNVLIWALAVDGMRVRLRSPRRLLFLQRSGALMMFAAGLFTLLTRRV